MMNKIHIKQPDELAQILNGILGSHKKLGKGEIAYFCPFCHHRKQKLQINIHTGEWHCWICNVGGLTPISLAKRISTNKYILTRLYDIIGKGIDANLTRYKTTNGKVYLPEEFVPLINCNETIESKNALYYLRSRDISDNDINRYNIGFCPSGPYGRRIIVPSYDRDGDLNYFVGRSYYESDFPYKNPPIDKNIVPFELYIAWSFPVILVEGVFDAIAVKKNSIPLLGKFISDAFILRLKHNNISEVYISLDSDAKTDIVSIANRLYANGIVSYAVMLPDGTDPGSMHFTEFEQMLKENSTKVSPESLVKLRLNNNLKTRRKSF